MEVDLPDFLMRNEYGEIRLTGHRIGLIHMVDLYNRAASPQEILDDYPALSLALIDQTFHFYLANREAVDAYVARTREEIEQQAAVCSKGPTAEEMRQRLISSSQ